ncbi:hypothetical protein [Mammaliicoccus sciuri]|uniref:hypothetical protein n=1 Tax=Mammaliicoccus sciuri TaxID=1296 RepID=UPI001301A065|nr:hypothetical protein [Mammaliicoccus sciuri]
MENNSFGKCDICEIGNVMSVDGLYSEIDNVMSIVAIDDGKDLEKLYSILKGVTEDTSIDELEDKINEETPQYKNIIDVVRKWSNKNANVITVASVLINILFFIYSNLYNDPNEDYKNIIEEQQKMNIQQQKFIEEQNKIIQENEKDDKGE